MKIRESIIVSVIFIASLFLYSSCRTKALAQKSEVQQKKEAKELVIEMSKTMCFGRCPVYEIKIYNDGSCTYTGKLNVEKIGSYSKTIEVEELRALQKAFEENKFMDMRDEYVAHVSDVPTTWISFAKDKKSKKIKDMIGAPKALKDLEKMIEVIAFSESWEKVNND